MTVAGYRHTIISSSDVAILLLRPETCIYNRPVPVNHAPLAQFTASGPPGVGNASGGCLQ
jgi:hypothetical protein